MRTHSIPFFAPTLLAAAALTACGNMPASPGRTVQIERTAYGIAHITASDYEGLAFGTAYAYAQDNVCQVADALVTARGERSRYFGANTPGVLGLRTMPNVQIDLFVRGHMDDAALAKARENQGPNAKAALKGYVAGYNRFLRDTPVGNLPGDCKGAAWVTPMTEGDLARVTENSMVLGGVGALADAILAAQPPGKTVGGVAPGALTPTLSQREREQVKEVLAEYSIGDRGALGGELGSNGWAFGRNATPDGAGVLLGNPHFPWVGNNRFWQMHLTIPGELDVMGATTGASPVVTIGFNRDVAWTHTVSTGKRFTLYELTLDPADPTTYIVDGQKKKMVSRVVSLPVPAGAPPVQSTQWLTDWGPVLVIPRAGLTWSAARAYAIKDANTLNARSVESWQRMAKAKSVAELRAAMGNQGIPWVNTIAADRAGNAMYADLSVVPDVSADMLKRCAPSPQAAALFNAAGLPVLNGSRSDCAWNRDSAAAMPGIAPDARMPVLVTPDWVQNSNDSFWLSNPSIAAYPAVSPMVGLVGTVQRLRTRSALMEIPARLSGTDGLPGNKMGVNEVRSVLFRDRNLAGMLVMDDLLAACRSSDASLNAQQREGCAVLAKWDRTSNAASAGAPLFREFWRKAKDLPNVWRVPFDPANPVTTPAGLKMSDATVSAAVLKALDEAVGIVKAAGYPADVTLGQAQYRDVRGTRVAIHGGDEFEGVLNKVESQGQATLTAGGYRINYGSSYIQAVTFDARGPVAYGLLTYGQGSSADSPHAYDQLPLFSKKEWVRLPYQREEVQAQRVGPAMVLPY
ncbi:penicillin acylase family protein [Caenimonas aquaedulcis]|uniref:Penicillin acylase family protein n=1 Tax=Caenimonas aquaedulcis TaxID=2793270 RepID=A0A931MHF0_9BURK|nr:penicillin acylase family protein [Caenimonas aquaedulcis]MBG9389011.1 penicillin acylase family protein [Caenimonas aquaedulcis]